MKNKFFVLVLVSIGLLFLPAFSSAQTKPTIPSKTYWCAQVEDILVSPKEFSSADKISIGVRIKLWSQSCIPGAPGFKLCQCAVQPERTTSGDFIPTVMSLRLIGLKYSDTETNLLEYHWSITPPGPPTPYRYGGFPVIYFYVSPLDIRKGYIEVWGWAPKKNPLMDNREFTIYASLDTKGYLLKMDNDPDYLKNGCFPPHDGGYEGDFRKTFKPRERKISTETIEKGIKKGPIIPKLPDLEIAGLETSWQQGGEDRYGVKFQDFTMKISVKNSGNTDIPIFKILVERKLEGETQYKPEKYSGWAYEKNSGTVKDGIIEVENLKAGVTKNIFVYADNSRAPKSDCWFRITLDPDNEIAELDENNNRRSDILFPSYYKHPDKYK